MAGHGVAIITATCLLLVLLAAPGSQAMFSAGGDVTMLTPDNFEAKIKGRGGVWAVAFVAPW